MREFKFRIGDFVTHENFIIGKIDSEEFEEKMYLNPADNKFIMVKIYFTNPNGYGLDICSKKFHIDELQKLNIKIEEFSTNTQIS